MKFISFLLVIVIFCSCTKKGDVIVAGTPATILKTAPPIIKGDSVTYLALGDSYTYGLGVVQNESYPYQLESQLNGQGYYAASPLIIANEGWTVADVLAGISAAGVTKKFDFITILIGVNDENKGTGTEAYTTEFDQLLNTAIAYANGYASRVFVISIPYWSVTPFATKMDKNKIASGVALFNSINEGQCKKLGANYLDITALSELAANDPTLTSYDGLHPSAKMYALWVNQFYSKIVATFN